MCKRLPPLNSLRVFESAARHLSFTKAATELYVTQAAISHQIKSLEQFLGFSLFKRKNRTLELTELGIQYYQEIAIILHKLAEITNNIRSQGVQPLTISVPQSFGIHWLVPRLNQFNLLHPEIDVRITGVDQDEELLDDDVDIAIYYGRGNWENLQVEPLLQGNLLILAAPIWLEKHPILQKQDLAKQTLLHIHNRENWQRMAKFLQLNELDIQHGPLFSHTFMALQAAILGQGVVLANAVLAEQEIANGTLQLAWQAQLPDPKGFYLVNPIKKAQDSRIQAFRDWILHQIHNEKETT
ncbi:MAG: transcriptional regulator GcvA [Pasteurellaceae bacterium]|nr:transcriptional regulator GcvA [Pasteurellaceae bacterium]